MARDILRLAERAGQTPYQPKNVTLEGIQQAAKQLAQVDLRKRRAIGR